MCSDIHLSHNAPAARTDEEDWYVAMARPLRQLRNLAAQHDVPVLIAGDIFDRWNSPARLINFALEELPDAIAVPGQHDLPNHSLGYIERSAYWTLVKAGRVTHLGAGDRATLPGGGVVVGFPWGVDAADAVEFDLGGDGPWIALVHAYCWKGEHRYPEAPVEGNVRNWQARFRGFDYVVFGDNHRPFTHARVDGLPFVVNCGGFMRRASNDDFSPRVHVLRDDRSLESVVLDTTGDAWTQSVDEDKSRPRVDLSGFVEELVDLGASGAVDFRMAVWRYADKHDLPRTVRDEINRALDKGEERS